MSRGGCRRPRAASKSVKLQRPDSGYRVQSLLNGHGRRQTCQIQVKGKTLNMESGKVGMG
jgi:hypothetical protein